MSATICLNMIVRDESQIIVSTLQNIITHIPISYWVICDTGSIDNTPTIIQEFFDSQNIPGELHQHEWKDFAHNRTLALNAAYDKTDYLLVFDADDTLVGYPQVPKKIEMDAYEMTFRMGTLCWNRVAVMNNRKKWKYVGVVHETPICDESSGPVGKLKGDFYCKAACSGSRSRDSNKYAKDAAILAKAYNDPDNETWLRNRYAFYCAQSYRDAGMKTQALEWYKTRIELGGWNQEQYVSHLHAGKLLMDAGFETDAIECWITACKYNLPRYETLAEVAQYYKNSGLLLLQKAIYDQIDITKICIDPSQLFLNETLHKYYLFCEMLLCYLEHKEFAIANTIIEILLPQWDNIGKEWQNPTLQNIYYTSCNYNLSNKCQQLALNCTEKVGSDFSPELLSQIKAHFNSLLKKQSMTRSRVIDGVMANIYSLS